MATASSRVSRFEQLALLPASLQIDEDTLLRRVVPEDAGDFIEIITNNPDTRRFVTWASQVREVADVVPVLQSHSDQMMSGRYSFVHEDAVAGYLGIYPGSEVGEYGMGYFLDQSVRGRGYAVRGVSAVIEAARVLSPASFYLNIAPENQPSIAVATKLGFQPGEMAWDSDLNLIEQGFRLEL